MDNSLKEGFLRKGFTVISHDSFCAMLNELTPVDDPVRTAFGKFWDDLVTDSYLLEIEKEIGGNFGTRKRRFIAYTYNVERNEISFDNSHTTFDQPRTYSNGDGRKGNTEGERKFELLSIEAQKSHLLKNLIRRSISLMATGDDISEKNWHGCIHFIRMHADGGGGIGDPSPEGVHRDNTYLLSMHLISRVCVYGGESKVYGLNGELLESFTLEAPYDSVFIHDEKVLHDVDPIVSDANSIGYRDMLIIDYKRGVGRI
jgi:hypothetical protein